MGKMENWKKLRRRATQRIKISNTYRNQNSQSTLIFAEGVIEEPKEENVEILNLICL